MTESERDDRLVRQYESAKAAVREYQDRLTTIRGKLKHPLPATQQQMLLREQDVVKVNLQHAQKRCRELRQKTGKMYLHVGAYFMDIIREEYLPESEFQRVLARAMQRKDRAIIEAGKE